MKFDPDALGRRIPLDWFDRYSRGVSGPKGGLDDSTKVVRVGLIVLVGFFVLLLGWAALAPLSGAAVANGVVTVAGNRQSLQTLGGGVVEEVLVREGQTVAAGEVLVRMNGLAAGGTYRQSQARRDALAAAEARLIAERDRLAAIAWPADFAARGGEAPVRQAMASQEALFASRQRVFEADRGIEQVQVAQARVQVDGPVRQLAFVNERVAGMRSLYRRGFAPKSVLYELEAAKVQLETEIASARAALEQANLTAARAEDARTGQVVEELRVVQDQLGQVGPALETARFRAERDVVRAPAAGAIVDLARFAPGSVLSPGQKLMDILPSGRGLMVEARIKPEDVDDVRVGSMADVRFTSVNPGGMSKIRGRVTTLSADRLTDATTGVPYYLAYIQLDARDVDKSGMQITAGLPASVNVRTKDRSFLDYLLGPLLNSFSKAGREE